MTFRLLASIGFAAIMFSCGEEKRTDALHYPIDSLLAIQSGELARRNILVKKTVTIGAEKSNVEYVPDSLGWEKELQVFRKINSLNKPANARGYRVTDSRDRKSNLRVRSFEAIEQSEPLTYLKIYYQGNPGRIRRLEAEVKEVNAMYEAGTLLTMEFEPWNDKIFLSGFNVKGGQKMILNDTVNYSIEAAVSLPSN